MATKVTAECVLDIKSAFGECPIWNEAEQRLYWIDVGIPSLNRFDPATGGNEAWVLPEPIGAVAFAEGSVVAVALQSGMHLFDTQTGQLTFLVDPEPERPLNRLNDGRCDRHGRFWIGSMLDPVDPAQATGALHCVTEAASQRLVEDIVTSNGIAFSPDDRTLYHSDSFIGRRTVWAYDFDLDDGAISNRRVFVDTHGMSGRPDGATVDADGCYWSASNDGGEVIRYTPAGRIDYVVKVPVAKPSMPCFGGSDLRTLFITSLRPPGMDVEHQPLAGGLFAVRLPFQGRPEHRFKV